MTLDEFIATQIKTMDELRALLHCHAYPQTIWNAAGLSQRLGIPVPAAATALAALAARGLLTPAGEPGGYRWQAPSADLARLIEQLADLDRERPVTLIQMIYHSAGSLPAPGDAFKIRKDKEL